MKHTQALRFGLLLDFIIALTFVSGGMLLSVQTAHAATSFNNEGISSDANTTVANFDGNGYSYSNDALAAVGYGSGSTVTFNGIIFHWPTVAAGSNDNWQTAGQVISISGTGMLAFLGAASNGPSSGTATLTYSDGSTQTFTLAFSDWTLNAGASQPIAGNSIAVKASYRNSTTASKLTRNTYVFYTSVPLTAGKTLTSVTLPGSVNQGRLHVFAVATGAPSNWVMYNHDLAGSGYNNTETTLTASNFPTLTQKWKATGSKGISDQPIIVGNTVYWGSWDGNLHATNITGANASQDSWHTNLGVTSASNCLPPVIGIASTPAYGVIGSTPTIYVGGGGNDAIGGNNVYLYAVNATTGGISWKTVVGSAPADFAWSSPLVYNGSIYYGIASFGDCPLTRGRILQINATTGAIQNTYYIVPSGCVGGGIWGTPSIDTKTGMLYIASGTQSNCAGQPGDQSVGLIELNASNLSYVASWQIPKSAQISDADFGSVPTLFSAGGKQLVGVANKNGIFYAFDRTNVAAGPVWTQQVAANTGSCPQCGNGSISPAVWDGSTLYVGGGQVTINGVTCKGSVNALNPATGAFIWQHCLMDGPVLGSLAAIPGVVVDTQGPWVNGLNMSTGQTIFRYQDTTSGATYYSPVSIANGSMFAPNLDGSFVAFGL